MGQLPRIAAVMIMLCAVTGCAGKDTQLDNTVAGPQLNQPPSMDYMYRSPPPDVAARLAAPR